MAIEIKERLLGKEDYEVALSVGHLASLYNYDMEKYDEAEKLYLRSIEIGMWAVLMVQIIVIIKIIIIINGKINNYYHYNNSLKVKVTLL